jgi:DNA primase
MALCVHHDERTPSMSLFERDGRSRYHCHGCGEHGDAIDLEVALSGSDVGDVIRKWGR